MERTESDRTINLHHDGPLTDTDHLSGTHRVQRIPKGSSSRHTSTASVATLPVGPVTEVEVGEVRIDRYRGRGRGGQRKNKVSTAVRVVHEPTGTVITRETGRSQKANLDSALTELNHRLQVETNRKRQVQLDAIRNPQVRPERCAKVFTHNEQRNEVVDHQSGRQWTLKQWTKGKMD